MMEVQLDGYTQDFGRYDPPVCRLLTAPNKDEIISMIDNFDG